jgi:hypothetical protein
MFAPFIDLRYGDAVLFISSCIPSEETYIKRIRCLRFAASQLGVSPTFTYKQLEHFPVWVFFWRLYATRLDANNYEAF